jgi:hypothetical protein
LLADKGDMIGFIFKDHKIKLKDADVFPQITMMFSDEQTDFDRLEDSFNQSWNWVDAREAITECTHSVLITDLMCSSMNHVKRIELFQKALYTIVENTDCKGIY